jgi:hypothetical protein
VSVAKLAASGPLAAGREADYELLVGEIVEGVRLHYGEDETDFDLALLQGDQRYARGLSRLAELGDLQATAELADVISLVAQAYAAGDAALADAVWEAGAVAVGWGGSEQLERAKALARASAPSAAGALLEAARERRSEPRVG